MEIKGTSEIANVADTAKDFNEIANAVSKVGTGLAAAGTAIYSNSQNPDGEVKKVGDKTTEEACDYSSQFIG